MAHLSKAAKNEFLISVVFAGFSAKSLCDRINDAQCKALITSDGGFRGNKITPLKEIADEAMKNTPSIQYCIVLERTKTPIMMKNNRDYWWHEEIKKTSIHNQAEIMNSEDLKNWEFPFFNSFCTRSG